MAAQLQLQSTRTCRRANCRDEAKIAVGLQVGSSTGEDTPTEIRRAPSFAVPADSECPLLCQRPPSLQGMQQKPFFPAPSHTPPGASNTPCPPPHRTQRRAGAQMQVPLLSLTHEPSGFRGGGLAADHCLRRLTMVESVVVNCGFHRCCRDCTRLRDASTSTGLRQQPDQNWP